MTYYVRNGTMRGIRHRLEFHDKSLTKQSFTDECDINKIMARFEKTGVIEHANEHQGQYGDFTVSDYHSALNAVIAAQDSFNSLPAKIRARFKNDPSEFLDFVNNPDNVQELRDMGLLPSNLPPETAATGESEGAAGEQSEPIAATVEGEKTKTPTT